MKVLIYSIKGFELDNLLSANKMGHEVAYIADALGIDTASKALGFDVVVAFAGDDISTPVVAKLHDVGVKYIALRSAGFDNIDLVKARELGIKVAYVPEYSPYAIAEHAVALMLALNRKIVVADRQAKRNDFRVDNLVGFDFHQKQVGIIGTGRTGGIAAGIMHGFGCHLLGYDIVENPELIQKFNLQYVDLATLCATAEIISIHTPLNTATKYLINREMINLMKPGVMLINTARGAVINTEHVLEALDNGKIGYLGLDVYEKEKGVFFYDHSQHGIQDAILQKLINYPNVIITPHQAFATNEALGNIAETVFYNIDCWALGKETENTL
jgi:D-lactate dehydrogenase